MLLRCADAAPAQATIYEAQPEGGIVPLQAYCDEDVRAQRAARRLARTRPERDPPQSEEYFFCCTWAFHDATGAALLLIAGQKGIIRILDANTQALHQARASNSALCSPDPC